MKRIATLLSILMVTAPLALYAGSARGGGGNRGGSQIHPPGTAQPGGAPQGTPGGQRLRDGSGSGQQNKGKKGKGQKGQNGQNGGQQGGHNGNGTCPNR